MELCDKVDYIRNAKDNGRLVIFVGAGVSKNSNIPGWYQLIKAFSKELPYNKCNSCEAIDTCEGYECDFSTDEFLKIPQYYYNTYGPDEYFEFIKSILDKKCEPNVINDIIMDLQPKHIITTNYDKLIENTTSVNRMLYKVICKDNDLLKFQSENYIIKMHGDISEKETIVLKEDDYLKYSFNHILIETMIKSLLLNNTFLFVGYSLNDYNLKLIIKWIDTISKQYNIGKEKCKNFILDIKNHEDYEIKYYEESGIYVINDNDISDDIISKYSSSVSLNDIGKKVYSVLNMINDDNKNYQELNTNTLYKNLQYFKNRRYISVSEIRNVYSKYITIEEVINNTLIIRKEEEYDNIIKTLSENNSKSKYIREIFFRAGIHAISLVHTGANKIFTVYDKVDCNYGLLELVQQNKFIEVYNKVINNDNDLEKAYYLHLCNPYEKKIDEILEDLNKKVISNDDYFELLSFKLNDKLRKTIFYSSTKKVSKDFENICKNIPNTQRKYFKYINDIYENRLNYSCYGKDIESLEKNYRKETSTAYYIGGSLYPVLKIQVFAYEYYYYIKLNHIMIDYFSNSKELFDIYIKSMLCTYIPYSKESSNDEVFSLGGKLQRYKLNKTDLDIITKYIDSKVIKKYFEKYSISEIEFEDDIDNKYIISCFENLCYSLNAMNNRYFVEYIKNYLILFTKYNLSCDSVEKVIKSINYIIDKYKVLYGDLEDEIIVFINYYKDFSLRNINEFIEIILDKEILKEINRYRIKKILKIVKKNVDYESIQSRVVDIINNSENKTRYIFELSPIISKENLELYKDELIKNINKIDYNIILDLVIDGLIVYTKLVEDKYMEIINEEIECKKKNPGLYSYPDKLEVTLEHIILLYLLNFDVNIERFFGFSEYSMYIEFIRFKENFNYNKIKRLNYMWLNFFRNDYYRNLLIINGGPYIEHNVSVAIENDYATEDEKKVYYKYFAKEF